MAWPTPQDYNEAVQNPRTCFSDPELRQGTPALTPLGLPRPITGGFASVYQLECPNRRWAVRCFLRDYPDHQKRYSAISLYLQAARLTCMVGFEFLERGILVRGQWYPILKMEWVDGEPLNDYIARNYNKRATLRALAGRWIELVKTLKQSEIAHGDLQHGNIVVRRNRLLLIDYDAMYVPALAGMTSHEVGHRNYQHPERTGMHYSPDLDNFSSWVIATSIFAQANAPDLWSRLNAGDECLLFRRGDFESPMHSKALNVLSATNEPGIVRIATELRRIFKLPLSRIPALGDWVWESSTGTSSAQDSKWNTVTNIRPAWLTDQIKGQEGPRGPQSSFTATPGGEATNARRLSPPFACSKCLNTMERFDRRRFRCKWCGTSLMCDADA